MARAISPVKARFNGTVYRANAGGLNLKADHWHNFLLIRDILATSAQQVNENQV
jgi:hypothetical protein